MHGRYGWFAGGRGRKWKASWPTAGKSQGYRYVGPCRCGWGPNAYYQDPSGGIVRASQVHQWGFEPPAPNAHDDIADEIKWLNDEKMELENRIKELEEKLKTKENKSKKN